MTQEPLYADPCWLRYEPADRRTFESFAPLCAIIVAPSARTPVVQNAVDELSAGITALFASPPMILPQTPKSGDYLFLTVDPAQHPENTSSNVRTAADGYTIGVQQREAQRQLIISASSESGLLYGVFALLRLWQTGHDIRLLPQSDYAKNELRMMNHWDNMDGSVERGYAGPSIFFRDHHLDYDPLRVRDYARLLASVGINAIAINNVNVHETETRLITADYLPAVAVLADIFRGYGIRLFLSINFASPLQLADSETADPLAPAVKRFWCERAAEIYAHIPDFGGFVVKADSEHRPGPFTYGRSHSEGANMLAQALAPFGGLVIWRCFVYNCVQDWRDTTTDRAKAAYDHFQPLDGQFLDNVLLQIKNGPMDFQVREPVSPLFGAMTQTNQLLEFQITQEYTGQQKHLCYLIGQFKEVLDFATHAGASDSTVAKITNGTRFERPHGGLAAVANIGRSAHWTGHPLAQANLYGYGRLAFNPDLRAKDIANEWTCMTFGRDKLVSTTVTALLMSSWEIYESYTAPLGVGWMVSPGHHYGPDVDGYEYARWGTYHYADCHGIGVDRTLLTGTGYAAQYHPSQAEVYESLTTCPDELLLFFHHVPYTHVLHSGKTVIQHIYDTHFEGAQLAALQCEQWRTLRGHIDETRYVEVLARLEQQAEHACEWRDVINTYFARKSGMADDKGREIFGLHIFRDTKKIEGS